jgi:uncharacterized protein (TIGR02646 family)
LKVRYAMIYIDRSLVSAPAILSPETTKPALDELARQLREEQGFEFVPSIWQDTRKDLARLFHSKCAYCESRIKRVGPENVDHFRPVHRAVDLSGNVSVGYWWLSYTWENLYLSCADCAAKYKRNRFPVSGKRAEDWSDLKKEKHLLLDPCQEADFQAVHLIFDAQGRVTPATERGSITIDVLGLNRKALCSRREETLDMAFYFVEDLFWTDEERRQTAQEVLVSWLSPESEYLAAMRQVLQAELLTRQGYLAEVAPDFHRALHREGRETISEESRQKAIKDYAEVKARDEQYTIYSKDRREQETYYRFTKRIEKLELNNFKCFRNLTLNFPDPETWPSSFRGPVQQAPAGAEAFREAWLTLLGENSTGKTAILQAIALALMGDEERRRLRDVRASDVLTHGQRRGFVKVHLSGLDEPIGLFFAKGQEAFDSNSPWPKVLMLGYGATRLLRDAGDQEEDDEALVRIENLFNPFARLNNVERWLADTEVVPTDQFNIIRSALMVLLLMKEGRDKIYRRSGRLFAVKDGRRQAFKELSDGYRAVVALALDIMLVLSRKWGGIPDAEGIVLIDEIGVHLHPGWQMQITSCLRRVFPNVQFVVATHQPLCLRGLADGEVVVMQRDADDQIVAITDLPPIAGLRVDQLLTSEHFGLNSTLDPVIDRAFNEYYELLALRQRSHDQDIRLETLKAQLAGLDMMGETRRDRLMLEAVDQILAQDRKRDRPRSVLKDETLRKVKEIWARLEADGEG